MNPFRAITTMCKSLPMLGWAGFNLVFAWAGYLLDTNAVAQEGRASHTTSEPESKAIAVDEGQFELRSPTKEDDTPGILKYGGYAEQQVIVRQSRYRSETGDATVEVVEHPSTYPYVKHDLLGTFFHGFEEQRRKTDQGAREVVVTVEYLKWLTVEPAPSHTICALIIPSNGAYHGFAGWYTELEGSITTVMLRFGTRGGLPRVVIDQYLKKYPSSIRGTVLSLESWETDDIAKWIDLLQTRANEDVILNVGTLHLHRYDSGDFGLLEAWNKRGDPAALTEAVNRSIERMNAWLAEREAKERDSGGRKHDGK